MSLGRRAARTLIAVVVTAFVGTSLLVIRAQSRTDRAQPPPRGGRGTTDLRTPLSVRSLTVRSYPVREENTLSGQVEPNRTATIASEVGDRMVRRFVERGDAVRQGAELAVLYDASARTALAQAHDACAQASAARRQAEADYRRVAVETDAARAQARAQLAQAGAEVDRARAQLAQASAGERKSQAYTRRQEIRQAEEALTQTRTEEHLAKLEHERSVYLVREGALAQQALDRARAAWDAASARRQSADQALSLAKEGARQEDREAAAAQVAAARAQAAASEQRVEEARAALRATETREMRLAALRSQIAGLRAQESQTRDALRQAQITCSRHTLRAPFAGRVLATLAEVGDMLAPGAPVVRLGEVSRVKVVFGIPEAARPSQVTGRRLSLTADALPGRVFTGRITALGYQADPKSRTFPLEVTIENPDGALLANMVARIRLPVNAPRVRTEIPCGAVASLRESPCVYVLQRERAIRRLVRLGAPRGDSVEILEGLRPGERIAAEPQMLYEGACVRATAAP